MDLTQRRIVDAFYVWTWEIISATVTNLPCDRLGASNLSRAAPSRKTKENCRHVVQFVDERAMLR
jgi:hypothetical protein